MLRRLAVVLVPALVAVPLLAAPASASCLDDLQNTDLLEGYEYGPGYSKYWVGPGYVSVSGTATVTVYGDALASDAQIYAGDVAEYTLAVTTNSAAGAAQFADCVAG